MSSVPPTPAETSLPTKKRVVASKSDQREVIVEFRSKELDDEMMHWLIQNIRNSPEFLMCTVHPKGDDFDQMVPFWFDAEVLFDGKDAQKVQFVKSGRSHCESFPANAKHQFWRYTFKEHTGGLSFKCLLDKDPVIADSSDEEEEEQVQEETGKRRKSSDSSSTKKKRGRRRKSVDVDVAAVAAAASPAAAKIASSPAASSPIARTPLTQEEALRVVNELERKVKELCDDARNRINGGVKK